MLQLSSSVVAVNKIGTKYKNLLENLGIYTVGDLLYHFPFRYDDYSNVKKIKDLEKGEMATVSGILGPVKNIYTKYGKRLSQATIVDESGSLNVIWFNSHYLKKVLVPNKTYNLSGKVDLFGSKLNMVSPVYEEPGENNTSTGRFVPIYPETSGVSSKWLRGKINEVLQSEMTLQEFLPKEMLEIEKIQEVEKALRAIHFPASLEEAQNAKKRFQLEELLLELLNVEQRKQEWEVKLSSAKIETESKLNKIEELTRSFPFELTPSQKKAVKEVFDDLKEEHPMNRLLEGDVGTGKTAVALTAAYGAYLNGLGTLYMAPTEILAKQHCDTFTKYLSPLGIKVNLITGSSKDVVETDCKIFIGTHALLFEKDYENIGLIVIDEQHRFGVEQRTKLTKMHKNGLTPHLLTMTATPIPRTLALTIYGDLEISKLDALPTKDRKITTKVIPEKGREKAFEMIKAKNEPTFVVCPFIEESYHENFENVKAATVEFQKLKSGIFKDRKMGLLHGKLLPKDKRDMVEKFEKEEVDVLVSTPVIEVGIDIPGATIMVIESAERYGLASLHQLRGRVGRGEKPGYCFIFMSDNNRSAYNRLKYMETIYDGLELAEIDLGLRGHGDIYGTMQHGFKKFKIARLSDMEMLEKAKQYAKHYYPSLDEFPLLKSRIYERSGRFVGSN